jgi:hypothetical protein
VVSRYFRVGFAAESHTTSAGAIDADEALPKPR